MTQGRIYAHLTRGTEIATRVINWFYLEDSIQVFFFFFFSFSIRRNFIENIYLRIENDHFIHYSQCEHVFNDAWKHEAGWRNDMFLRLRCDLLQLLSILFYVVCFMLYVSMSYVVCFMLYVSMSYVLCFMLYVLCCIFFVVCSMLYFLVGFTWNMFLFLQDNAEYSGRPPAYQMSFHENIIATRFWQNIRDSILRNIIK